MSINADSTFQTEYPCPSITEHLTPEETTALEFPLHVTKVSLKPGESLLIKAPSHLTKKQLESLTCAIEVLVPDNRFVVMTGDLSMTIIKQDDKTFALWNGGPLC